MEYAGHGSDKDGTADLSVTEQCRALSPDLSTLPRTSTLHGRVAVYLTGIWCSGILHFLHHGTANECRISGV